MPQYQKKSFEELRFEDYSQQAGGAAGGGAFGNTGLNNTAGNATSGGLFGGGNNSFGAVNNTAGGGLFGSSPNNNNSNNAFGASSTNTGGGLFGATSTPNTFGATNTASSPFNSNTNAVSFGGATTSNNTGGGLFGATNNTNTTFGAQPGLFGSTQQPAQNSPFGGAQQSSQAFGSTNLNAFGSQQTAGTTGGGLFGNNNTSSTGLFGNTGGAFGNTNTSTGAFGSISGANNTNTGGGGLFGSANTTGNTGGGGLFGGTNNASNTGGGGLFGNTNNTSGTGGGGLFGNTGNTSNTGGGGLFGNTNNANNTGGGLFGNTNNTGNPSGGGLFGSTSNTSNTGGGGLFGSTNTNSLNNNTNTTGGLFGSSSPGLNSNTGGGLFGNTASGNNTAGGGLFGASNNTNNSNFFGNSGGLVSNTTSSNSQGLGLFGAQNNQTGQSQQQNSMNQNNGLIGFGTGGTGNLMSNVNIQNPTPYACGPQSQMVRHVALATQAWRPTENPDRNTVKDGDNSGKLSNLNTPISAKTNTGLVGAQTPGGHVTIGHHQPRTPSSVVGVRPRGYGRSYGTLITASAGRNSHSSRVSNMVIGSSPRSAANFKGNSGILGAGGATNNLGKLKIPEGSESLISRTQVLSPGVFDLNKRLTINKAGRQSTPRIRNLTKQHQEKEKEKENENLRASEGDNSSNIKPNLPSRHENEDANHGSSYDESSINAIPARNTGLDKVNNEDEDQQDQELEVEEKEESVDLTIHPPSGGYSRSPISGNAFGKESRFSARSSNSSRKNNRCPTLSQEYIEMGYFTSPSIAELEKLSESELAQVTDFAVSRKHFGTVRWIGAVDVRDLKIHDIVDISEQSIEVYKSEETTPERGQALNRPAICTVQNVEKPPEFNGTHEEFRDWLSDIYTTDIGGTFINYTDGVWMFKVEHF